MPWEVDPDFLLPEKIAPIAVTSGVSALKTEPIELFMICCRLSGESPSATANPAAVSAIFCGTLKFHELYDTTVCPLRPCGFTPTLKSGLFQRIMSLLSVINTVVPLW